MERVTRLFLSVLVGFWVARYLGPDQFGRLSYAIAVVTVFGLLAELGLDGILWRRLLQSPEQEAALLATTCVVRLSGAAVGLACLWAGVAGSDAAGLDRVLLVVLGLTLLQPALLVADACFRARLRSRTSVLVQTTALAVGAITRVALIRSGAPLEAFAWAAVVEMAVAALALRFVAHRAGIRWRLRDWDPALARRLVIEAWPLALSGLAVLLYMRIDVLMLREMAGDAAVGLYAAGTRFTEIWFFLPGALAASVLPSLLQAKTRDAAAYRVSFARFYLVNAAAAFAIAVLLCVAAPWLIRLAYGGSYDGAATVLAVHAWCLVFVFLGVARTQFLVNEGYHRFYLAATVAGLAVNVVLNWFWIPRAGAVGAALATVAGQAVAAWLSSFCFAPARAHAWLQTRALLCPVLWPFYVRRT